MQTADEYYCRRGEICYLLVQNRDATFSSTFSRKMLTPLCAFRLAFSEVMLTDHSAEENDAALQHLDSVATGHFCICVHFMIPALSSVSKSEQIIVRRSIMAHVLPVKNKELQLFESLGPRHVNCSLVS